MKNKDAQLIAEISANHYGKHKFSQKINLLCENQQC